MNLWHREPARILAVVVAAIGALASFGMGLTSGQSAGIVALVAAVLSLLSGEVVRSQVIPVKSPVVTHGPLTPDELAAKILAEREPTTLGETNHGNEPNS